MTTKTQTYTYKTASVPIQLDVHYPTSPSSTPLPLLIWFHGGGLLQGHRAKVAQHHIRGAARHGYVLISADYRLCPQVGVAEVVEDVKDCLQWCATELSNQPGLPPVDPKRITVSGSSAGGYLALLAGLYCTGPAAPKVVLPIYPITNPFGSFFTEPQIPPRGRVERGVVAPFLDRDAAVQSCNASVEADDPRNNMYGYMMQEAILAELLHVEPGDDTFVVAPQILKRGSAVGFPPTFIVHGDADRFVGVEQADEVVEALKKIGAVVEYERPKQVDHLFDMEEHVELEGYYAFLKKHL